MYDFASKAFGEAPLAVMKLQTTGLNPGHDRIVECSVIRIRPGESSGEGMRYVFDSVINPHREPDASWIHGLTKEDVRSAPTFAEALGGIVDAIAGSVVCMYNASFYERFLCHELIDADIYGMPPTLCLMKLDWALSPNERHYTLAEACLARGLYCPRSNTASAKAMASASLLSSLIEQLRYQGIETFGQLEGTPGLQNALRLDRTPLRGAEELGLAVPVRMAPRIPERFLAHLPSAADFQAADRPTPLVNVDLASYEETVLSVVADYRIGVDELALVRKEQERCKLSREHIRAVHAKVFSAVMGEFIDDEFLDDDEAEKLRHLWKCLHTLGWAPGMSEPT